ncbi:similar to Saccharomyces cerevisiae YDR465C RMT2 Arginine N5 methyltransferase [Maudiozyma saulgeensis]|uniref:Arginine N-methyltransferase 2 n=1 Tax=Maudiozyma saulgeensis TaxID=1789683 RepID=A0A1X7R9W3_9SACH|nr:similar to Saccharomyces cerevisiae YDR465C RMT2 Arginine N5 methyltransferase [Kazachstania saulgeensis]
MSDLHHLLTFPTRPIISDVYETQLAHLLKSGIPSTYTLEQVAAFEQGKEDEEENDSEGSNTTPLHILARSLPKDATKEELDVVLNMMNTLFEYGAGWNFLDYENKSIGDLLLEAGQNRNSPLYQRVVEAGVSAELLLRKVNGGDVEFLDDLDEVEIEDEQEEQTKLTDDTKIPVDNNINNSEVHIDSDLTASDPNTYLNTKLEYTDDKLITKDNKDGVMMDWEDGIMKLAADTLFPDPQNSNTATVLNIGFGMGIIDSYIQEKNPAHHYICEAHPDVLSKMRKDGWYEKSNVTVLEGKWQDTLNKLLDDGTVFFDGIYYDTFSEHYEDMLDLYDVMVGLIKPEGVFSFFNGLGADRPICYDVYKRIVEMDVNNYGMKCEYTTVQIGKQLPDWSDVKRSYYNCDYYYHPRISFM